MAAITQHFANFKQKLNKVLHEKNKFTEVLEMVEQKTGVDRTYVALGKL